MNNKNNKICVTMGLKKTRNTKKKPKEICNTLTQNFSIHNYDLLNNGKQLEKIVYNICYFIKIFVTRPKLYLTLLPTTWIQFRSHIPNTSMLSIFSLTLSTLHLNNRLAESQ